MRKTVWPEARTVRHNAVIVLGALLVFVAMLLVLDLGFGWSIDHVLGG